MFVGEENSQASKENSGDELPEEFCFGAQTKIAVFEYFDAVVCKTNQT